MKITGIAESARPFSSGNVSKLVWWMCGIISASITTNMTIFALNNTRLNISTMCVPMQTIPPATIVNSKTPLVTEISVENHWLRLADNSSPAPLIYAAVRAYIKNNMLKPVSHCPGFPR
ncbi:hypothetical protein D3C75_954670 [compost metagenome]